MGRILTMLGLKRKVLAAATGSDEASVTDGEAAAVDISGVGKADAACLTMGDVNAAMDDTHGTLIGLASGLDGYEAPRLVTEAGVEVTATAATATYTVTPYFAGYKCKMEEVGGGYAVSFQMAFRLGVSGEEGSAAAELEGVHYHVKSLKLYRTNYSGSGTTYVDFTANLVLGFDGNSATAASGSLWSGAGNTVQTAGASLSVSSGVATLAYTVTDASSVSTLGEFYSYVQNGYYRLVMTGATGDSRFDNSDVTVTT